MLHVLGAIALLVLGWATLLFFAQRQLLFPAPPAPVAPPPLPTDAERVELGPDAVEAFYFPPRGTTPGPVVVYTHGNGELIDYSVREVEDRRQRGLGLLLVEYPGYGRSGGRPSEASITTTMLAAHDFLTQRPEVDAARIVAHGRSLGGGAACVLSRHRPLAALVLESTFTSVRAFAPQFGMPGFLVRDPFDNLGAVKVFDGPILLIHGDHDEVIPPSHATELADAIGGEVQWLPCGHNDCPPPWSRIETFLSEHDLL